MKTIFNLRKSIFYAVILITAISFVSCSDDDDPAPSVVDVYGSYKGNVSISIPNISTDNRSDEGENGSSTEVTAIVKNDTIYFDNFPLESILIAVEKQEDVSSILESMDKVNFKVGYDGALNEAQDSIALVLDPKPLEFTYKTKVGEDDEVEKNVKVTISIPGNEKSAYSDKVLKFYLIASEILLDEVIVEPFDALYYNFNFNKQ